MLKNNQTIIISSNKSLNCIWVAAVDQTSQLDTVLPCIGSQLCPFSQLVFSFQIFQAWRQGSRYRSRSQVGSVIKIQPQEIEPQQTKWIEIQRLWIVISSCPTQAEAKIAALLNGCLKGPEGYCNVFLSRRAEPIPELLIGSETLNELHAEQKYIMIYLEPRCSVIVLWYSCGIRVVCDECSTIFTAW